METDTKNKKTYEELERELDEANQLVEAIRKGQVDTIYTDNNPLSGLRLEKLELVENRKRLLKELAQKNMELNIALHKNNQLAAAIEQATELVMITDKDGTIEYVNPAFVKVSGYSAEEVIGRNPNILKSGKQDHSFYEEMWKTLTAGKAWSGHLINKRKSGEIFDEELTISPIYEGRKIAHYVGIIRDVSEKVKLQQQLIRAEKLSTLGTFVAGIAHELNNPLTGILGNAEIMLDSEEISPDLREGLDTIYQQSLRTAKIVKNLMQFCREDDYEKAPININELMESILKLQHYTLEANNIEVKTIYEDGQIIILGDQNQLQSVFLNIITNAQHALLECKKGRNLTIRTQKEGEDVCITVENNGPQISEENLNKMFDPFFTTKKVGEGTGLGLSISYGIIQDHAGEISAKNIEAGGVRFTISLPVKGNKNKSEAPITLNSSFPKNLSILLVEDDAVISDWLEKIFFQEEFSVIKTTNGNQAVEAINNKDFDIILSDVLMPGMSGLELVDWLHKNKPDFLKKFVLITGLIKLDEDVNKYQKLYGLELIYKPFSRQKIFETIRKVVSNKIKED